MKTSISTEYTKLKSIVKSLTDELEKASNQWDESTKEWQMSDSGQTTGLGISQMLNALDAMDDVMANMAAGYLDYLSNNFHNG